MSEATDNANVLVRPPIALLLAIVAGLGLDWLYPLPFISAGFPHTWAGAALFMLGLAPVVSAHNPSLPFV